LSSYQIATHTKSSAPARINVSQSFIIILGNPFGSLSCYTRNGKLPSKIKWTVPISSTVYKRNLWLKSTASWCQRDWNCKVISSSMHLRRYWLYTIEERRREVAQMLAQGFYKNGNTQLLNVHLSTICRAVKYLKELSQKCVCQTLKHTFYLPIGI
jgi:hypothetical protein